VHPDEAAFEADVGPRDEFRPGAQDGELAFAALCILQHIATLRRLILVAGLAAEKRHRLSGEGEEGACVHEGAGGGGAGLRSRGRSELQIVTLA
jgi:hypothetical protein